MSTFNTRFMYDADEILSIDDIPLWGDGGVELSSGLSSDETTIDIALVEALNELPQPSEELFDEIEEGL